MAAKSQSYRITNERIIIERGLVGKKAEHLDLFRVRDFRVKKSMTQRARGRGDLTIMSTDSSTPQLKLESIQSPDEVAETLRSLVKANRRLHGVVTHEGM